MTIDGASYSLGLHAQALANAALAAEQIITIPCDTLMPLASFSRVSQGAAFGATGVKAFTPAGFVRDDRNPATGMRAGLLLEPGAANLAPYSLDMTQSTWAVGGGTKTTGIADMFGTTLAAQFTANGSSASHFVQGPANAFTAGTSYCLSAVVKAGSITMVQLFGGTGAFGTGIYANFDISGGAVLQQVGCVGAGIINLGNGWYRIWIVATATTSAGANAINIACISSGTDGRLPTNTLSGSFFLHEAQSEVGWAPSSIISTTAGSAVRSADAASLNALAVGIADGTYAARVQADDLSWQPLQMVVSGGQWAIPVSSLNRPWLKQLRIAPAVTAPVVFLHFIGQSNAISSGTGQGTPLYTTPSLPDNIWSFAAGRLGNGDPVQQGGLIPQGYLRGAKSYSDDAGGVNYPMTLLAYLSAMRDARLGGVRPSYLCRADALGGIPVTYLASGAETGQYTGGAPKYFYVNARASRSQAKVVANALGRTLDYRIVFVQGEDPSVATDLYQTYLGTNIIAAHLADSVTDIGAAPSSFVVMQTNGLSDGTNDQRPGPLAQIAETRRLRKSTPLVALAGSMYFLPIDGGDPIHAYNPIGRSMMADLVAYVQGQITTAGSYTPCDIARTATPALAANQGIRSVGLAAGTAITALGTGTGGVGTYTVNNSQTVASSGAPLRFVAFGAVFDGYISGTTLTVTNIVEGAFNVVVSGAAVTITLNRPIAVDTTWVPTVGSTYGFEWSDSASNTISSVTVTGATVTLNLSGNAGTARTLGYAISNCGGSYLHTGGAGGTNWAAPRGVIYHDTGVSAEAYVQQGIGYATLREYLVRFAETF